MAYRMKGAPMKRNFGIGAPKLDDPSEVNPYTQDTDQSTLTSSSSNSSTSDNFVEDTSAGISTNNTTTNTTPTETKTETPSESTYNKDGTKKDTGRRDGLSGGLLDNWIRKNQGKSFREILGLSKEQIAARKAKKEAKIEAARTAVGSGTETLKQAKLVTRANKKNNRKKKKEIKKAKRNKIRLKKYREKNPVTGKEAINLLATQTKKQKTDGV